MEPVSALALACNILDLIERGYKCAATIKEVHDSETGLLRKHEILVGEVDALSDIAGALNRAQEEISKSPVDARMKDIAKKCLSICAAIQALVNQCKPEKEGSFRSAAQASVRIFSRKSDIEALQSELGSAQKMMDSLVMTKTLRDVARLSEQLGDVRQKIEKHARQSSSQVLLISEKLRVLSSSLDGAAQSGDGLVLEQLREVLSAATEATEAFKMIQILDNLHFPTMKERFSNVNGPARSTFDWVFEDSKTFLHKQPGSKITFRDWLRSGSGIFHVEGKPGSGKSTLMKHICEHRETREILCEWAGEKKLITSQFFFWRPGTPEQKSLRGLIRGLLWGIIRQEPQLAKLLFPRLWLSESSRSQFIDLSDRDVDEALGLLVKGGEVLEEYYFCFFIDGLDEFDDNKGCTQYQLTQYLQQWASSSCRNVKLCASTRQLPVFGNAFSPAQRLTIHIFTDKDIKELVKQRLEGNDAFQKLAKSEKDRCDKVVCRVIESAEGVFLWVCVLLNLLEDSLGNGDSITMLESIVKSAPTELNDFFGHILNSIPFHYRHQAFIILALAMRLDGFLLSEESRDFNAGAWKGEYKNDGWSLSLLSCSYLLEGLDNSSNLEKVVRKVPESLPSNTTEYRARIERGSAGVAGRCKGLLERRQGRIEFIHRSVPEFLQKFLAKTFPTPELNDEIVSSVLAWMMLVDLSCRKNKKPEGHAENDPEASSDSESSSDSDLEDDLSAPTVLINQDLDDGDARVCILQLLFQIRQAPGTNSGSIMPLLQQVEQEILHHQFGIRTFNEVPEDKRHYRDMALSTEMFSLFSIASALGFIEIILWDHENESLSLTRGQDWVIANLLGTAISTLPHYRCKAKSNRFFGLSHATMLEYFFQAGVSVDTEVDVDHKYPPWTEYPAPELRSVREVQLEPPEQDRWESDDSSSAEAGSHRVTLQNLLLISLLSKPRHKSSETRVHLCLDPFPSVFGEMLRVLLRYGATLSITMSLSDLSWLEDNGTERSKSDPDGDIELLPSDPEDKDHEDNDDDGDDDNTYFLTGRSKYQLLRRIHLIRDEDRSEIITVCGVVGSSAGLVRSFWELLISSGGSITLRDFLCFIKAPSLDMPLPPVGEDQPDVGLLTAHSSSSSEDGLEQAEASDNEDFGDQATKQPGFLSWAALVVILAAILAYFLPAFL